MAKKTTLPAETHDHFRKANVLHKYVTRDLTEATQHALEAGQELIAAKALVPHGRWESECSRLFDGSLRTARFYMQFAKNMDALPKTAAHAVLLLEGTMEGAAKAAKAAANPKPSPKPDSSPKPPPETIDVPVEPPRPPADDAGDPFEEEEWQDPFDVEPAPPKPANGKPPKQYDRSAWLKRWEQSIGPLVRLVDAIAKGVGESKCKSHKAVQGHLKDATNEVMEWMGK